MWFEKLDYDNILAISEDADDMPDTFDRWLVLAEDAFEQCNARGMDVIRVIVNSDALAEYCRTKGLKINRSARLTFCSYLQVKGSGFFG